MPLRLKRCLEPPEQFVECFPELGELVVAAAQAEAPVEVAGRDVPGGGRDRAQGSQEPAGEQPAERDRQQGHDRETESELMIRWLTSVLCWTVAVTSPPGP